MSKIEALARKDRYDMVVVCCDRGRSFRHEIYDAYKGNRQEHTPIEIEYAQSVKDAVSKRWYILERDGYEGDDVLTSLVLQLTDYNITILAEDKDLYPLVACQHVRFIHTQRGTPIRPGDVETRYGVKPEQMRDYLIMAGDTADNWKGIPGIGEGYAAALLKEHGSLKGIWEAAEAGKVDPPNVRQAIIDSPGIIDLGVKVCTMVGDLPGIGEEIRSAVAQLSASRAAEDASGHGKATGVAAPAAETRGDTAERKERPSPAATPQPPVPTVPQETPGHKAVRTGAVPTEVPPGWSSPCNRIAGALAKAQGMIIPPAKNKTAKIKGTSRGTGKDYEYSYKYSDLAAIVEAIRIPLSTNGIAVVQSETSDKKIIRTMLVHESGQWCLSECCIVMGDDKNDLKGAQAHGSALTYTKRHALCLALGIAAEDDDDGKGASDE